MPLSKEGKKVMASMRKQYGEKKAKEVFYASINAKKAGTNKWHKKAKGGSFDTKAVVMARAMRK